MITLNKKCSIWGFLIFLITHTAKTSGAVTIRPFKACRANDGLVGLIACEDYNLLSMEQAKKIAQANPISFVHIARPEVDCSDETKPYDPIAGKKGYENLQEFLQNNLLKHDKEPALYIYGRIRNNKLQAGIIALVDIQEYADGNIKRHENVVPTKEKKLALYTELQQAQVDPVLLLHKPNTELAETVETIIHQAPHQAFYANRTAHLVWVIKDKKVINRICGLFKEIETLYIADGHHRTAVAAHLHEKNPHGEKSETHDYCMAGIFPFDQVTISAYNRIFKDLNHHSEQEFLDELKLYFDLEIVHDSKTAIPHEPHVFGIYCMQKWYKATLKKNIARSYQDNLPMLDIAILSNLVLKPFLNIDIYNPDERTEFVGGMWGLDVLEKNCKEHNWPLAVAFFPVRTEVFSSLVNNGKLMPPKSTWFDPKIRPGLFTYTFDCCEQKESTEDV